MKKISEINFNDLDPELREQIQRYLSSKTLVIASPEVACVISHTERYSMIGSNNNPDYATNYFDQLRVLYKAREKMIESFKCSSSFYSSRTYSSAIMIAIDDVKITDSQKDIKIEVKVKYFGPDQCHTFFFDKP